MKKIVCIILLVALANVLPVMSQANKPLSFYQLSGIESANTTGNLKIYGSSLLTSLTQGYTAENLRFNKIPGWRVQIFLAAGVGAKEQATKIQNDFVTAFPERKAYLVYHAPYFKVHVGNFRTKRDAKRFQLSIRETFPQSWPVKDQIEYPDL